MAVGTALSIILYDNHDVDSEHIAARLQEYLDRQGVAFSAQQYADVATFSANLPQHLILIYSQRAQRDRLVNDLVDSMLAQAVERRVGGIVIVMAGSPGSPAQPLSLPKVWASIPTYSAASYRDNNEYSLEKQVWSEIQHVKRPYSQAALVTSSAYPLTRQRSMPLLFFPVAIVIVCLLVIGGAFAFFVGIRPTPQTATSTPPARATSAVAAAKTATLQATAVTDAEQQQKVQALAAITKTKPSVSGFQASNGWVTSPDNACALIDTTYTVNIKVSEQYQPCLATGLTYKNFAMQVTIDIKGDAGGIIFRSSNATYYRLGVKQIYTPTISLFLCSNGACNGNNANSGQQQPPFNTKVGKNPVQVTVIVRDKNIDIYGNDIFLEHFTDTAATGAGQVGVYAADLNYETAVTFSDLKIWSLDGK